MPSCRDCVKFDSQNLQCTVPTGSPLRKCVIALLEEELSAIRPGIKVLEIGCGAWDFAKNLVEVGGGEWFGLEPTDFNEYGGRSIATFKGSVHKIPSAPESFDYVLGNQTMEHWIEFGVTFTQGLTEIHRVLKTGGTLSLNVPIHLHGHEWFVRGNLEKILEQFDHKLWDEIRVDYWRKDYEPLEPYVGHTLNGYSEEGFVHSQPTVSSYIMRIRAKKKKPLGFSWLRKLLGKESWIQ